MKLYFARHGESVANVMQEFSNSEFKHPLTAKGVEQAHLLAENLASRDIARIFSSPVLRAAQTAEILAQVLHLKVEISEALREWSVGVLEGRSDEEGWAIHHQVQEDWFLHQKLDSKIEGGESFFEIQERFVPFVEELVQDGQNTDDNVVLVGHGGLYIAMLPVIFKNIGFEDVIYRHFPNTAYALGETRADGLYCIEWCGAPVQWVD